VQQTNKLIPQFLFPNFSVPRSWLQFLGAWGFECKKVHRRFVAWRPFKAKTVQHGTSSW